MWKRLLASTKQRKNSLPVGGNVEEEEAEQELQEHDGISACTKSSETKDVTPTVPKVHYSVSVPDLRQFQGGACPKMFQDQYDAVQGELDRYSEILDRVSDTEEFPEGSEQGWWRQVANVEQDYFHENDLFFFEASDELAVEISDCVGIEGLEKAFQEFGSQVETQRNDVQVHEEEVKAPGATLQGFGPRLLPAGTVPFTGSANIDAEYIRIVLRRFQELGWRNDASLTKTVISTADAKRIIKETVSIIAAEPNIVDISVPEGGVVRIIGDIHGHLYDFSSILEHTGYPNRKNVLLFNGDYVDRGSWGTEVLLILCLLKLCDPRRVFLLRGNHETSYCNVIYGFRKECIQKYNVKVYLSFQQLFCHLPVAAVVSNHNFCTPEKDSPVHSSFTDRDDWSGRQRAGSFWKRWRKNSNVSSETSPRNRKVSAWKIPLGSSIDVGHYLHSSTLSQKGFQQENLCGSVPDTSPVQSRAGSEESLTQPQKLSYRYLNPLEENERRVLVLHGGLFRNSSGKLGNLKELGQIQRNLHDPVGVLEDVLWSDPDYIYGFGPNRMRGAGIAFGPDITKQFLRDNNLSYIIRSHEGPDAREKRKDFPNLTQGHSVDFVTIGRRKKDKFSESIQNGASSSDCDSIETLPLLVTVFSAPAYPEGPNARNNLGAICTLDESMEPSFETFEANQRPCKSQITSMLVEDAVKDLKIAALERSSFGRTDRKSVV